MGDTVQTGTGKFDPAWKCKFTTAARELNRTHSSKEIFFLDFDTNKTFLSCIIIEKLNNFASKLKEMYRKRLRRIKHYIN